MYSFCFVDFLRGKKLKMNCEISGSIDERYRGQVCFRLIHGHSKSWGLILFEIVRSFFIFFNSMGFIFVSLFVQVLNAKIPTADERREWWQSFYRGAAFPSIARVLLRGKFLR